MRNQGVYERKFRKVFLPILEDQRSEALYNLEAHASNLAGIIGKDLQGSLFDANAYNNAMSKDIVPVLSSMAETQGGLALTFAGDDTTEFKVTANLLELMRKSTAKMAKNFNQETLDKLSASLTQGIEEGEGLGELKQRVNGLYDLAEQYRAERLARTETLKTSNAATNWAYKQTGYVKAKEWYANPGACEICDVFDGKVIGLDETYAEVGQSIDYTDSKGNEQSYAIDYDTIENPPVHPNCRCTIVPVR